jgi:hypothetical protein
MGALLLLLVSKSGYIVTYISYARQGNIGGYHIRPGADRDAATKGGCMWNRYLTRMQDSKWRWPAVLICILWLATFAYRVWHGHEHDFWWIECATAFACFFNIVIRLWPRGHIQA